jgi:hypothetical protein
MNIDIEVLVEAYSTLKQYIPVKDRQEAADAVTSVLVDLLGDDDLKAFAATDTYTKASFREYSDDYDEKTDDEDEDDYR